MCVRVCWQAAKTAHSLAVLQHTAPTGSQVPLYGPSMVHPACVCLAPTGSQALSIALPWSPLHACVWHPQAARRSPLPFHGPPCMCMSRTHRQPGAPLSPLIYLSSYYLFIMRCLAPTGSQVPFYQFFLMEDIMEDPEEFTEQAMRMVLGGWGGCWVA